MLNLSAACRSKDLRYALTKTALVTLSAVASLTAAERDIRLVAAVKAGDKAAASSLLRQHVNVNASEPDGTTALHWAVRQDDLQLAGQLIAPAPT